jgi:hypothetical protein
MSSMSETGPVEDIERLGEHDQGDRTPVPDVLAVRPRMALEKRALVDVKVPIGDADGEVADRVGCDVDAAVTSRSRCIVAKAR